MQAINSIDKNEIAEMRAFKNVPELVLNVLEAVCILLGVKPDRPTAKNLLADLIHYNVFFVCVVSFHYL